jgi:hypothetical protein
MTAARGALYCVTIVVVTLDHPSASEYASGLAAKSIPVTDRASISNTSVLAGHQ